VTVFRSVRESDKYKTLATSRLQTVRANKNVSAVNWESLCR